MIPDRNTVIRGAGAIALICLVGVAFVGSYVGALHDPQPHEVPISVVGPPELAAKLGESGAFKPKTADSPEAAAEAIDKREVYASIVAAPALTTVTTAPAAGVPVSEVIDEKLVPELRSTGTKVKTAEVHGLGDEDARGLSGFYLAVGWTVAGYLGATFLGLIFTTAPGLGRTELRLGAIATLAIVMGLLGTAMVHLLGALDGSFLATSAIGALTVFAVGAATVALQSLFGIIGTGVAILIFVVLGNPSSSGPLSAEMMPGLWRTIGPFIPIGAAVDTLRNISYFPAAPNGGNIVVLVAWAVIGSGVALLRGNRNERLGKADEDVLRATSG